MSGYYPPGVTGREYEIAGPQSEWTRDERCPYCDFEGPMEHEAHYSFGAMAFCPNCAEGAKGFVIEPDEEEPDLD